MSRDSTNHRRRRTQRANTHDSVERRRRGRNTGRRDRSRERARRGRRRRDRADPGRSPRRPSRRARHRTRRRPTDTRASTAGWLPDAVGAALTALLGGMIVALGLRLGYNGGLLAVLCLTGVGAAVGLRATANRERLAVLGALPLWLAALVFAAAASALASDADGALTATVIAAAALLGPFAVVGNTVRTYGEGTGRTLLRRYLVGTLVLAGVVIGYGLVLAALSADGTPLGGAGGLGGLLPTTIGGQFLAACVLYPLALYLCRRASETFPAEAFVPIHEINRLQQSRKRIETAYRRGWQLLGVAGAIAAVGFAARFSRRRADEPATLVETIEAASLGLLDLLTAGPLLVLAATVACLACAVVLGVSLLRTYGTESATALTQTVAPPLALAAVLVSLTTLFSGLLPLSTLESVAGSFLATGSPLHRLLVEHPSLLVLVSSTLAILISAVVFWVPTALAAGPALDDSLAGLAGAVLALAVVVLAAVVAGESAVVIVAGVAGVALVWELGEYATVAAGELRTPSAESGLPPGFSTLASVHAAASLGVAVAGAVIAGIIAALAGGLALPGGFALLAVIVSVLGLAGLILLLTG